MATLLEKARAHPAQQKRRGTTPEDITLALAWVKGEIGITQISAAYGYKPASVHTAYIKLACALKAHLQSL